MPLAGGLPTRHTFDGGARAGRGWTPDGAVLYATEFFDAAELATGVAWIQRPASSGCCRWPRRTRACSSRTASGCSSRGWRSRAAAPSATRAARSENLWRFTEGEAEAQAAHGRFQGHQPQPDVVAGPHLFRQRPRRRDESLVHETRRHGPEATHPAPGSRREVAGAGRRAHRLSTRRGPAAARPRERQGRRPRHPAGLRLRPAAREVGEEAAGLPDGRAPLAERRPRWC